MALLSLFLSHAAVAHSRPITSCTCSPQLRVSVHSRFDAKLPLYCLPNQCRLKRNGEMHIQSAFHEKPFVEFTSDMMKLLAVTQSRVLHLPILLLQGVANAPINTVTVHTFKKANSSQHHELHSAVTTTFSFLPFRQGRYSCLTCTSHCAHASTVTVSAIPCTWQI